ncbi:fluconazole resistance protein 1 [Ophiostoma piceae UAMH 11346]|uniref:Fluconazole resistance protein 1 n=1 Tax=Ophiostoma piceae (strain UAMH 11346) TaxID=1262450 RepID=S3BRJ7_OPHP1|nr:fluconazole resistance protein 1 [Ophiostoma piceae UAMH 11346]
MNEKAGHRADMGAAGEGATVYDQPRSNGTDNNDKSEHTTNSNDNGSETVSVGDEDEDEDDSIQTETSPPVRIRSASRHRSEADLESNTGVVDEVVLGPGTEEKDPFEVAWDGGDADPLCPRSMSTARKWLIVFVTCFGSSCVTCASSVYTSSYTGMNAEFGGTSTIVATLGLSTFVLGIALGPAWSPLSEFYGRRPIYLGSFFLFTVWIIPSAVAKNIETMVIARFFQGFTGSAFLSVAGGTVGDLFTRETMQAPMAVFSTAPFLGPSIGPLIGGFINTNPDNWRWTHYTLIIWAFCLFFALFLFVPETYHPVLLQKKAQRLRKETGDDRWQAPLEKANANKSMAGAIGHALLRPFQLLRYEPMCLALDLYSAILLGIIYLFFGAFPLVFEGNHGFTLWQTGLSFMGMFVGMAAAGASFPIWTRVRAGLIAKRPGKQSEPEDRLPSVMVGAICAPIGLFWFGWTSYASIHWIVPIIGSAVFGLGALFAFSGIFTFLVDAYPLYAASALAGNAFVRCTFAAAFPLFGVQMYKGIGDQWATSVLAFMAVAMMPFPFFFFKYGKRLRGHSRFAVN